MFILSFPTVNVLFCVSLFDHKANTGRIQFERFDGEGALGDSPSDWKKMISHLIVMQCCKRGSSRLILVAINDHTPINLCSFISTCAYLQTFVLNLLSLCSPTVAILPSSSS